MFSRAVKEFMVLFRLILLIYQNTSLTFWTTQGETIAKSKLDFLLEIGNVTRVSRFPDYQPRLLLIQI